VRIGVLGGTFDPPHHGHLVLARSAAHQLGLDRVLLVPASSPPHKPGGPTLPAAERLGLVQAAVAGDPVLEASGLEVERPGPSYTVDTLERVARDNPGADLWFILGADQMALFASWERPQRIAEIARLAVARRAGADRAAVTPAEGSPAAGRVDVVDMPEVPISSTLVRERLAGGCDVTDLVPPAVASMLRTGGAS
jgi:nicotinate-nucleotide adenylyltransferase